MALVTSDDLAGFLHVSVDPGSADVAIRLADSWLRTATRIRQWPPDTDPTWGELWGMELELAGLAYDNPRNRTRRTAGILTEEWNYRQNRRQEILLEARRVFAGGNLSSGDFPYPTDWPEPVDWYAFPWMFAYSGSTEPL